MEIIIPGVEIETESGTEIHPSEPLPRGKVSVRPNKEGQLCWYIQVGEDEADADSPLPQD